MTVYSIILISIWCCSSDQEQNTQLTKNPYAQSSEFRLAKPIPIYKSALFTDSIKVDFKLDYPDRQIYYTLDGTEPSKSSKKYENSIFLHESSKLLASAFHSDHQPSEIVKIDLIKAAPTFVSGVKITPDPNEKYSAQGKASLFDMEKGSVSHADGRWLGFDQGDIQIDVVIEKKRRINDITLSALSSHGAWIFLPSQVILQVNGKSFEQNIETPKEALSSELKFISFDLNEMEVKDFRLLIKGLKAMPEWHQGKGKSAWVFIDEIILN